MKKAGRLTFGVIPYTIYLCRSGEAGTGIDDETAGACHLNKGLIAIRGDLSKEVKVDTLWHEAKHAIWEHSGYTEYLSKRLRLDRNSDEFNEIEEASIQILTPYEVALLPQIGKVKLG